MWILKKGPFEVKYYPDDVVAKKCQVSYDKLKTLLESNEYKSMTDDQRSEFMKENELTFITFCECMKNKLGEEPSFKSGCECMIDSSKCAEPFCLGCMSLGLM